MSNDPSSQPPFQQGYFTDNPYATPGFTPAPGGAPMSVPYPSGTGRRGLVNHVRIIASLNLVQGLLELAVAGICVMYVILFATMGEEIMKQQPQGGQESVQVAIAMFGTGAVVMLLTSIVRIWASIANMMFRGRIIAIVSLAMGLLSVFTGACALTSVALSIYGLIVLLNTEVAEAFEMRAKGQTSDDILRIFNNRPA